MSVNDTLKAAAKFYELPEFPNGKALLLKAATTSNKKPKPDTQAARLGARVKKVFIDREWVRQYNLVCGFKEDVIALTAAQVVASPLHMFLLSRPEHPMPMLGMVHLHNSIESIKPLEYGVPYDVVVTVGETRGIPQGLEFDLHTEFFVGDEVHWKSTMSILCRVKGMPKPASKPAPAEALSAVGAQYTAVKVPENQGRKYAKVSNDYNPIHLYAQTAKLFGFKQAIVHGMWTAAKTLSIVEAGLGAPARKFDLSFKQPVFLPSGISVKHVTAEGASAFEVLAERDSKVLMVGSIAA
ncbi:acyl dehydratase [Limnobacter thiooxidans]|uniref:MaoC/PaaZ C-terminal domain-containing protein n=1 Tax=Limnobacter thiooxidans TaxID=131080 RepID=A0AA86IY51_9BURK|nr:MaoC/PaaZ C-terminal domain-containing protein [Limnobacter sp.]MCZ8014167.1 MaoC/PaaZ C-terminal domain-containing protein [Limnobacter sp.]RZS38140.1 acyl dehydratase [Limnobacter thiooxidans]BET25413.1 MaoC/PaaZ C-terminal domain-containing protein [Limnobacter thiooxidans]